VVVVVYSVMWNVVPPASAYYVIFVNSSEARGGNDAAGSEVCDVGAP
jgi:hypothetical protein